MLMDNKWANSDIYIRVWILHKRYMEQNWDGEERDYGEKLFTGKMNLEIKKRMKCLVCNTAVCSRDVDIDSRQTEED